MTSLCGITHKIHFAQCLSLWEQIWGNESGGSAVTQGDDRILIFLAQRLGDSVIWLNGAGEISSEGHDELLASASAATPRGDSEGLWHV